MVTELILVLYLILKIIISVTAVVIRLFDRDNWVDDWGW